MEEARGFAQAAHGVALPVDVAAEAQNGAYELSDVGQVLCLDSKAIVPQHLKTNGSYGVFAQIGSGVVWSSCQGGLRSDSKALAAVLGYHRDNFGWAIHNLVK